MPAPEKSPQPSSGPAQVLSLGDATAIIVGLIVGAGIFGTPSIVAGAVESRGSSSPYGSPAARSP